MFSVSGSWVHRRPRHEASTGDKGAGCLWCPARSPPGTELPLEMRASQPVPSWSLCLLTLPGGRFQIETRVHHKCINMSKRDCLKLFYYTGAWSSDQEWLMSLGFGFEDGQVFIKLHHFWPWPFAFMFLNFCWHRPYWSPSNYPSQNRFTSCFSREVLLALSSGERKAQRAQFSF